jgi:hypothetical protein
MFVLRLEFFPISCKFETTTPNAFSYSCIYAVSFNDCVPALAIQYFDWNQTVSDEMTEQLNSLQAEFRNAFAIVSGAIDHHKWMNFQKHIKPGNIRIFRVKNVDEAVVAVGRLHDTFKETHKFQLQSKIIDEQRDLQSTPRNMKRIMTTLLELFNITQPEIDQILGQYHSVAETIKAAVKVSASPSEQNPSNPLGKLGTVFHDSSMDTTK